MNRISVLIIALSTFVSTSHVGAVEDITIASSPQRCEAENPKQASSFIWTKNYLVNISGSSRWIICPLNRGIFDSRYIALVRYGNLNSNTKKIRCVFREVDLEGNIVKSYSRSKNVPSNTSWASTIGPLNVSNFSGFSLTTFSVACKLPPLTAVIGIYEGI